MLLQNDPNCSGVAQHAVVLGPGHSISADSLPTTMSEGSSDPTLQRTRSQEPQSSQPAYLAPRAAAIQEQGFTDEVAARIEAPQRPEQCTSQSGPFLSDEVSHTRWTSGRPL